jgi:hypothetical protein
MGAMDGGPEAMKTAQTRVSVPHNSGWPEARLRRSGIALVKSDDCTRAGSRVKWRVTPTMPIPVATPLQVVV